MRVGRLESPHFRNLDLIAGALESLLLVFLIFPFLLLLHLVFALERARDINTVECAFSFCGDEAGFLSASSERGNSCLAIITLKVFKNLTSASEIRPVDSECSCTGEVEFVLLEGSTLLVRHFAYGPYGSKPCDTEVD